MVDFVDHVVGALLRLEAFHIDFSGFSIFRKNDMAKRLGLFDVRKVSETPKYAKAE
jgi:hypothetical protein